MLFKFIDIVRYGIVADSIGNAQNGKFLVFQKIQGVGKALQLSSVQYIQKFSAALVGKEENDLVFQALETAGFSVSEILGIVNVAESYMRLVLSNQQIESDTQFSARFRALGQNLWKLNRMLGIVNASDYTLKDDFNTDEFFARYSTLTAILKELQPYQAFAVKEYAHLQQYIEIYRPIHELLTTERAVAEIAACAKIWTGAICERHCRDPHK